MPVVKVHPVKGQVTLNGAPLSGGRLSLYIEDVSKNGPAEATAEIKSDGSFEPVAVGGTSGLMPGRWKVVVSPTGYREGKPYRIRESIPARYTREGTTNLFVEVVAGENAPTVALSR